MEIILKNGEKIKLEWNPIVYEYLEEYEGGIENLKNDLELNNNYYLVMNFIIYCMFQASYSKEISYREAISLVDVKDYEKIVNYILEKESITDDSKPKGTSNVEKVRKKHKI